MPGAGWIMMVTGRVDADVLDDWNKWYDEVHLPEIVDCPGFVRGTRYVEDGGDGSHFATVYVLDDPKAMESAEFDQRRGVGPFGGRVTLETRLFKRHLELE